MSLPRVLVIGGEASRVSRLCDLCAVDLLQGVDTLALAVESVHKMHVDGVVFVMVVKKKKGVGRG